MGEAGTAIDSDHGGIGGRRALDLIREIDLRSVGETGSDGDQLGRGGEREEEENGGEEGASKAEGARYGGAGGHRRLMPEAGVGLSKREIVGRRDRGQGKDRRAAPSVKGAGVRRTSFVTGSVRRLCGWNGGEVRDGSRAGATWEVCAKDLLCQLLRFRAEVQAEVEAFDDHAEDVFKG